MSRWANWSSGVQQKKYFTSFILKEGGGTPMQGDPQQIAQQNGWTSKGFGWYQDESGQTVAREVDGVMYQYDGEPNEVDKQFDSGNPTPAGSGQKPADRARSMGLQSNGRGGYVDPQTGQVVARTVNNELVFYDQRPGGGAVSDGAGGQAMAQDTPSWQDPVTGMVVTPPAQPESPQEIAAIPDPIPAQAPNGYNQFIQQKKLLAYAQKDELDAVNQQAPPPGDMDMGGGDPTAPTGEVAFTPEEYVAEDGRLDPAEAQKRQALADRRAAAMERRQQADAAPQPQAAPPQNMSRYPQPAAQAPAPEPQEMEPPGLDALLNQIQGGGQAAAPAPEMQMQQGATPVQQALGNAGMMNFSQFRQAQMPKNANRAAAYDAQYDPTIGGDGTEEEMAGIEDNVDRLLQQTSPEALEFDEVMNKQRLAKAAMLAAGIEQAGDPSTSPVEQQELASIIAMMHGLKNPAAFMRKDNEELMGMLQAVYPGLATDKRALDTDWLGNLVGHGTELRQQLGLGDDDIDEDWAVERTANRNRIPFMDQEDQQDMMQWIWDSMGQDSRNFYDNKLDSFNPADTTFARRTAIPKMKKDIQKIIDDFGGMRDPSIVPSMINLYLDDQIKKKNWRPVSLKQGDMAQGKKVGTKAVNIPSEMGLEDAFDLEYDEDGSPRMVTGGFEPGYNPGTSLSIGPQGAGGEIGFDSHSMMMKPFFDIGGKRTNYSIENKPGSLVGDAFETRERIERDPEGVPWKSISKGLADAAARGGGVPVGELNDLIKSLTGEEMGFRGGVRPKLKKDGTMSSQMEEDEFTEEDIMHHVQRLQRLMDEKDDDGNPFFNLGTPNINGEDMDAEGFIRGALGLANSKDGVEKKFPLGIRTKLRQFQIMDAIREARAQGKLPQLLARLKMMAGKEGFEGDWTKGGYYKQQ